MLRFLLCSFALLLAFRPSAQNLSGQWKGSFTATGSGEQDEYVLELQISGKTQVSGYSYTYFYENGFRYFTICKISGYLVEKSKTITVTETEKIKGNIPPGIMDCLQIHTLTYFKNDSAESLEGKWKPAPGFDRGCGSGTTTLSRKMLVHTRIPGRKPAVKEKPTQQTQPPSPQGASGPHTESPPPQAKPSLRGAHPDRADSIQAKPPMHVTHRDRADSLQATITKKRKNTIPSLRMDTASAPAARMDTGSAAVPDKALSRPSDNNAAFTPLPPSVRQRSSNILQTIEVSSPEIKIELYDDGVIDHDTVTVYFNGKTVVSKAMLKHQPIKVTLMALPDRDNDLILYADNLGDIPPNTALMVVIAGEDRYDIRVTSDEQKNGAIRFRLKKTKTP